MTTLLTIPTEDREKALTLGALLDPKSGQWFAPAGIELAHFNAWLPSTAHPGTIALSPQGISLTELLARATGAINSAFPRAEWVRIEISDLKKRGAGHVYMDAIDRDPDGNELSKSKAIIWKGAANKLGEKFFKTTGAHLSDGMKVLVLMQPRFDAQYGLSLIITDIDPNFTLGDMQARLKRIREQLQEKGDADLNRSLPTPTDFCRVGVIAPENAAGLEDFQAAAKLLENAGLCTFEYFHATFEGENAKDSLKQAFIAAHNTHEVQAFDALAIIRGGGASAGLAWLNEYVLARMVCRFRCPVFTGIGHEKDATILDEFAHTKFGTPSKVIGHIREVIAARANQALENWTAIVEGVAKRLTAADAQVEQRHIAIQTGTARKIDQLTFASEKLYQEVRTSAVKAVDVMAQKLDSIDTLIKSSAMAKLDRASVSAQHAYANVGERAITMINQVEIRANNHFDSITLAARRTIDGIEEHIDVHWQGILSNTEGAAKTLEHESERCMNDVRHFAGRMLVQAENNARELISGIVSHGVDPTVRRGFAVVKSGGKPVSSKAAAEQAQGDLELVFRDGTLMVTKQREKHG